MIQLLAGGGLPLTLTFSSINSINGEAKNAISENHVLSVSFCSISNVTVTRNTNLITVSFTVDNVLTTRNGTVYINMKNRIPYTASTNGSYILTVSSELVSLDDPLGADGEIQFRSTVTGTGTGYYSVVTRTPGTTSTFIRIPNSGTAVAGAGLITITSAYIGKTISFSFKNPCVYNGLFCNPPYKESLDCTTSNPFMTKAYLVNYYTSRSQVRFSTSNWKRIMHIVKIATVAVDGYYKLYISKGWTQTAYETHIVTLYVSPLNGGTRKSYLSVQSFTWKNSFSMSKFRLVKDPEDDISAYLEVFWNQSAAEDVEMYVMEQGDTAYLNNAIYNESYYNPDSTRMKAFKSQFISSNTTYTGQTLIGSEVTCTNLAS